MSDPPHLGRRRKLIMRIDLAKTPGCGIGKIATFSCAPHGDPDPTACRDAVCGYGRWRNRQSTIPRRNAAARLLRARRASTQREFSAAARAKPTIADCDVDRPRSARTCDPIETPAAPPRPIRTSQHRRSSEAIRYSRREVGCMATPKASTAYSARQTQRFPVFRSV